MPDRTDEYAKRHRLQHALEFEAVYAAGVFPFLGATTNTEFLDGQIETDRTGYIVPRRPPTTETSVTGVFAAGEVADPAYRQAVTAAASGCRPALDAERWLAANGIH